MESATTLAVVTAGLFFSLCLALLAEELIFGAIFHFFFANVQPEPVQAPLNDRLREARQRVQNRRG